MYLFAETSGSSSFGWIIIIAFWMIGLRKICTFLGGNKTARDAAKWGGLAILRNLFK